MSGFKVGDWVIWESQSGGKSVAKVGKVVAVVPPRTRRESVLQELFRMTTYSLYAIVSGRVVRDEESYLVEVEMPDNRYPRLYHPRNKFLKHFNDE